jgi:uncharacterized membrane protein YkvA (DUF1232 family)
MEEKRNKTIDYVNFEEKFRELIEQHKSDKDYKLIKDYPAILSIVNNISTDRNSDGVVKMLMNSAVSYFVLPTDIVSEKELGIKGYIDDFFMCIAVLRELLEYDRKLGQFLISKYWKLEESYESYIPNKYYAVMQRLGDKITSDIISSSGLQFVVDYINSKKTPRTSSERKIRELEKKLWYMFYLFFNRNFVDMEAKRNFDSQFFGTEEFLEFKKKIELLSESDDAFKQANSMVNEMLDIEEQIKKARAKRILK